MVTTETPGKTKTVSAAPEWVYVRCPYCGRSYSYVKNSCYKPKTCSNYECQRRYLHIVKPYDSGASLGPEMF